MAATLDVSVTTLVAAPSGRVRAIMFDPRQDPSWMAAVTGVEPEADAPPGDSPRPGGRVRRTGRFLGRTLRWTTEVTAVSGNSLDLTIVDGPMRGTVTYRIEADGSGSRVTIRNIGQAPGFAPRWLLLLAMRRSLTADLRRLQQLAEHAS